MEDKKIETEKKETEKKDESEVKPPEKNPYEEPARAKGWKPKEEFDGDKSTWVGAEEFLKREPLFDKIRGYGREIKELKKTIDSMTSYFKKAQDAAVAKAISELKAQRKDAIQTGDVDKVEEIDKAIEEQKKVKEEQPTKEDIKPEIKEWVSKNGWFDENAEMRDFAIAYNNTQLKSGNSLNTALSNTEKAIKRAFPDYFNKNQKRQEAPPSVETPQHEKGGEKKYIVSRLSADQKRVYDQIVKRDKFLTHDEYFKSLEDIGELI